MRVRILNSAHDDMREGSKTYRYGYLDKVMSVTDNGSTYTYEYHADGQLARANYGRADMTPATVGGDQWYPPAEGCPRSGCPSRGAPRNAPKSEDFLWDGLALIQRGDEHFINEPHIGNAPKKLCFGGKPQAKRRARRARKGPRGNPVASSKGTSYFNDALGTTVGSKKGGKYSAAALTAFGENLANDSTDSQYFTGKPFVKGLGHAFLMCNYRASLAKWQTADPMGYPDGWNQLAYCGNGVTSVVDLWGCKKKSHGPHLVGVKEVVWKDSVHNELTYGVDIYGQCDGSKITDKQVTHSGSMADGYTAPVPTILASIGKLLPENAQTYDIGLIVFTKLFVEEVPFSRKVNKQGEDPYLEFEVMLRCVVTLYYTGDDKKTAPMPYTLTLKKQLVQFSCEE